MTQHELWRPNTAEFDFDDPVRAGIEQMNRRDYHELVSDLRAKIEYFLPDERYEAGMTFAVLTGENPDDYSASEAIVSFNPYANGATDNMLIRHEFIRLCAENAGVRDEDGKLLPVIMIASPSVSSELVLDESQLRTIRKEGRFSVAAEELMRPVRERNFGRVALAGFSQGADMATSAAESAYSAQLDATSLTIGDPAGVTRRGILELGIDFMRSAPTLKDNVMAGGVEAVKIAQGLHAEIKPEQNDMLIFARSALNKVNRSLWRGLTRDGFHETIGNVIASNNLDQIVVAWGGNSSITPAEVMRREFAKYENDSSGQNLTTIEVKGAQHGWGDNLPLLAKLYLKPFKA